MSALQHQASHPPLFPGQKKISKVIWHSLRLPHDNGAYRLSLEEPYNVLSREWGCGTCGGFRSPSAQNLCLLPSSGPCGNTAGCWQNSCDACITDILPLAVRALVVTVGIVGVGCTLPRSWWITVGRKGGKREQQESSNSGNLHGCFVCQEY